MQFLEWIEYIWITYSFKSHTSKRKSKYAFAAKIKLTFIKKTQGVYKIQGLSHGIHDQGEITLAKIYAELQYMQCDFYKKIEAIKFEIRVAVGDKLESWKNRDWW